MNTVFTHIGQAGNQIGKEFWNWMVKETDRKQEGFYYEEQARAIFIDSEPKVVEKFISKDSLTVPLVNPHNIVFEQSGRGNNFGFGYKGDETGNALLKKSIDVYRKEVEKCDLYLGGVIFHSLAGGTGSGFTSAFIEAVRESYPKNYIVTTTIWPRSMGETCLQYYNTCLALPKLQQNTDAIILYQNDKVANILDKHPKTALSQLFTMEHINEYIGLGMQQALAPTPQYVFDFTSLMDLSCCSMFKFLECDIWPFTYEHKSISGADDQWGDVCSKCINNVGSKHSSKGFSEGTHAMGMTKESVIKHKSIAIRARLKSSFANKELYVNHTTLNPQIKGMLDLPYKMVDWNPDGLHIETYNTKKHMTVIGNRTSVIGPLREALDHAELKFKAKEYDIKNYNKKNRAYVDWYKKYGVEESDFEQAFEGVSDIIDCYRGALI